MKVILREDIPSLGKKGDIVNVADGYGRNYLIPKNLALPASPANIRLIENERRISEKKLARAKDEALKVASKIESLSLTIEVKAGEEDKIFGSVTSRDIENRLKKEGIMVDRKNILLEEPIKSLGVYNIPIKLHPEVTTKLKVWVVKEEKR